MLANSRRSLLLVAAVASSLTACAHPRRPTKRLDPDIDNIIDSAPSPTSSRLPPPNQPPPDDPKGTAGSAAHDWPPSQSSPHRWSAARHFEEPAFAEPSPLSALKPQPLADKALAAGPKPDPGDPAGRPSASRPDKLVAAPTEGQPRYFSPAPLKDPPTADPPEPLSTPPESGHEDVSVALPSARAAFAPAPTVSLDDAVPETGTVAPTAIGSYHIQVAADRDFRKVVFNKIYPFMTDIDIEEDLTDAGIRNGVYWIRWSLVDLLEFEQPFTNPRHFELGKPRASP